MAEFKSLQVTVFVLIPNKRAFNFWRSNDVSSDIVKHIETIMTVVIEESDDVSAELLKPVLDNVKMDNKVIFLFLIIKKNIVLSRF